MKENEITEIVIGCAIMVHRALGPGLLESAYEECLYYELLKAGLKVKRQEIIPIIYGEIELECGYRCDLLINDKVIIELKSVKALEDIHFAQILTYLKLTGCRVGLLMNFNVLKLTDGLKRVVNNY